MNLLLVDAHSQGYYHQQSGAVLKVGEMEVQGFYNTMRAVKRTASIMKARVMVLWDGKPVKRNALFPNYKTREPNSDMDAMKSKFKAQRPLIQQAFSYLGVEQLIAEDGEADDLAGLIVAQEKKNYDHIYLLSGDGDWKQLVCENVSFINQRDDKILSLSGFLEDTGFHTPLAFVQGKALQGDSSDTIPGVGGIGEKGAKEFLAEYGSVAEIRKIVLAGGELMKSRSRNSFIKLSKNQFNEKLGIGMMDAFIRNLKLMMLLNCPLKPDTITSIPTDYSPEKLRDLFLEYNFQSILDDLDVFFTPFKRYGVGAELA
ncbi:5'-3' exonuclease H3TH domain-containing protein (plasmid) [Moellerella wisconsensis]|uniref:5'-3' exonuclease H3TH domain-containing protein n=1 Tax=Moellerella wisconsensis TaxID=158849 RepID=UPI0025AF37A5|nr:5'-3' exonuclease H3TH domain-containing protein [Moellerella wisconsensis]WJW83915.1 5'-3' exonuclease H3TH domain-containing protein [Moellerella wisconsensis]